jgi:hypothetical protein
LGCVREDRISIISIASRPALESTLSPYGALLTVVKRPERKADQSHASSGEIMTGGATPPSPHAPLSRDA